MASDASDEDIFDYDDEEASDMEYDDGDSSINEGISPSTVYCFGGVLIDGRRRYGSGHGPIHRA